jgi:hypothetical protein
LVMFTILKLPQFMQNKIITLVFKKIGIDENWTKLPKIVIIPM